MNKNESIDLIILSPKSLLNKEDMLQTVRSQCELLPQYLPQKWNWFEPLKHSFDPAHPETIIHANGRTETTLWKRTGKDRASGHWGTRWANGEPNQTHADITLAVYSTKHQLALLHYLKKTSLELLAEYAFLDAYTDNYKTFAFKNGLSLYGGGLYTVIHKLRHWLPDMMWATVFGPPYVELFGKECLLSTPAYKVEELDDERIFIQLTPSLDDCFDQFDEVMAAREVAKHHLGYDCFYQPDKAYDPNEEPEKAGKVFRVPTFHLLNDSNHRIVETVLYDPKTGKTEIWD